MPRIFDLKTRAENTQAGSSNPCGICRRQFAKYTCPSCNLQYCSLVCYRSEPHSACTEAFYKTALTEQIQSEPARTDDEKRQMLELLKRFEEESLEEDEETDDSDDIAARLQGVDLDKADYDTLWGLLSEDERQKFTKIIMDPSSEDTKQLLGTRELLESHEKPWWTSEELVQTTAPPIRKVPSNMLSGKFNPLLLFNVFHTSLTYAYTVRTFAVSMLSPPQEPIQRTDGLEAIRNFLLPLSPFLRDRKSTIMFTSVDSVVTDWASRLSELPKSESLRLLIQDAIRIFRVDPVVVAEDEQESQAPYHNYCVRFLSDLHDLFDESKGYAHIAHKLMFYLAFATSLPVAASRDLVLAMETWEAKQCDTPEDKQVSHISRVLVEEL